MYTILINFSDGFWQFLVGPLFVDLEIDVDEEEVRSTKTATTLSFDQNQTGIQTISYQIVWITH